MKIPKVLNNYLWMFLSVLSIVAVAFFIRWLGIRGVVGLFVGMGMMGYLLFSNNALFWGLIALMKKDRDVYEEVGELKRKWSK